VSSIFNAARSTRQEPVRADDRGSLGDWELDASLSELSLELGEGGNAAKRVGRVVGVGHEDVYEVSPCTDWD
jgi:hypothetical protein